jgi:hypothetical protein
MALIMVCLCAAPLHAALSSNPGQAAIPQPEVGLEPQDVVRIVINALANNDKPFADAGIATTFAFASPSNKVNTGPLDKFTQMVKNDVYGIMVDHVESNFSKVVYDDSNAYQLVQLKGKNGIEIVFAFRLSKQIDGEFDGMWMTDAVWPVGDAMVPQQGF